MKKKIRFLAMLMAVVFAMTAAPGSTVEAASLKKPAKVKISSVKATSSSAITVKWKKASKAKGYQVYVAKDKKFKKGKKTATTTAKSKSISGLNANTTYYVKVRAYNKKGSKKKYGSWSTVKKVKTAKAAAKKKTTNQTTTSKPAASNPTPSTPSQPAHQHVWEEVVEERVVDSYAITPFSEGVNPASDMNKYRCMCGECERTGNIFGGYGEDEDIFKEHMEEVKSPGWYEEVWETHSFCVKCDTDLEYLTSAQALKHQATCDSNRYTKNVVVARIEHPSHTAGEKAKIIVGYKCSCGATKAAN